MKQLSRIEAEPLSEKRWARIERSLMARVQLERQHSGHLGKPPKARFRLRPWLLAAAVSALAIWVAVYRLPTPIALEHPSRITTGQSPSHLALPGLAVDVQPESAVVVGAETPQGLLLVLDRGSIVCQVAPRAPDAPVIVQAGASRIRVVGTRFSVTRVGEIAKVRVHEGVVEVTSGGQTQRVRAGEHWPRPAPKSQSDGRSSGDDRGESGTATSPAPSATPPDTIEARTDEAAPGRPASRRPTQGSPSTASKRQTEAAAKDTPVRSKGEPARPSSQTVFEQATALERSDPGRAAQLYRSLESRADSWASNALYARGRLAASQGNPSEARRLLQRYLERFPRGSNAEDARAVLRRLR